MCKGIAAQSRNMTGLLPSRVTGPGTVGPDGPGVVRERERASLTIMFGHQFNAVFLLFF